MVLEHYKKKTPIEICTDLGGKTVKADSDALICIDDSNEYNRNSTFFGYKPGDGFIKFSWEKRNIVRGGGNNYVCLYKDKDGSCNEDSYKIQVHNKEKDGEPTVYFKKEDSKPIRTQYPRPRENDPDWLIRSSRMLR